MMSLRGVTAKAEDTYMKVKNSVTKKKFTKKRIILAAIALVLIIALIVTISIRAKSGGKTEQSYTTAYAQIGDITETIEQSGTVEPYERREITSLVKGEIIESAFEEGDYVEEGQTLYRIDDEDAQLNIEKASINLEETEEDIKNLYIYAPAGGTLSNFNLKEGESAKTGVIGYITDNDTLTADIPFTSADFKKIRVGDSVTVTSALYMTSLTGKVTHKYDGNLSNSSDGASVKNIEVQITNPGALATGTTVAATVSTGSGDVYSTGSGVLENGGNISVNCEVQGTVSSVNVKSGDKVRKGQLLAVLENRSLYTTKKSNELSLRSSEKTLENYNITAPISGTIITKNSKLGDKIDNSNSSTVMMVIADMSKMKFTISVDELDIAKIHKDQKVIVDADAIEDHTFEGRVTSVAAEGVSSGDGVTTYQVEIVIDEPGELKSGMNVNANIIINEAKDVVYIPEEALMMTRGTSAFVLVKSDGKKKSSEENKQTGEVTERPQGTSENEVKDETTQRPDGANRPQGESGNAEGETSQRPDRANMPQGESGNAKGETSQRPDRANMPQGESGNAKGEMTQRPDRANMPQGESGNAKGETTQRPDGANVPQGESGNAKGETSQRPDGANMSQGESENAKGETSRNTNGNASGNTPRMGMNIPDGYELVQVEFGVSDGTNVEIKSGLSEGDEIIYIAQTASATNGFMMGRMPGGMGGGMPGGMSGGMRGGMSGGMSGGSSRQSGGMSGSSSRQSGGTSGSGMRR